MVLSSVTPLVPDWQSVCIRWCHLNDIQMTVNLLLQQKSEPRLWVRNDIVFLTPDIWWLHIHEKKIKLVTDRFIVTASFSITVIYSQSRVQQAFAPSRSRSSSQTCITAWILHLQHNGLTDSFCGINNNHLWQLKIYVGGKKGCY